MINIMINATAFWQVLQASKVKQNYQRPCKFKKLAVLQPDSVVYFKTTARIISIARFARCVRDRNDSKQFDLAHAVSFVPVGSFGNMETARTRVFFHPNKLTNYRVGVWNLFIRMRVGL